MEKQNPITVKELIKALEAFDSNLPMYIADLDTGWDMPVIAQPGPDCNVQAEMICERDGMVVLRAGGYEYAPD